jgi:flavorubredoxin
MPAAADAVLERAAGGDDPVALVPGSLYLLGGSIALDGRVSWVPRDATGFQPVNTYLLVQDGGALVIDPGIYVQHDLVGDQLERIVPRGSDVSIYLTRAEPDVSGNLGEIAARFKVAHFYCGGGPNPFDAFDAVGAIDPQNRGTRVQMERTPAGYAVPVGGDRGVEVLRPIIRLLATYWGYDRATRTLFTSDSFGHHLQDRPDDPRILRGDQASPLDPALVKAHLLAKFTWLANARTRSILNNLRQLRQDRDIERIAPGRGLVIEGRARVREELDAMEQVLGELAG